MNFIAKLYTYCVSSILLFGVGLIVIASSFPVNATNLHAYDENIQAYTAVSMDYSNLSLEADLG